MGSDQLGQIKNIIDVLGYPEDADEEFEFIQIDRSRDFIKGLEKKEGKMKKMIEDSNINPLAGDLLLKMLRFNPNKRISVQEAIAHPYFQEYSKILGEPPQVPKKFDWSWEQGFFSRGILQKLIY